MTFLVISRIVAPVLHMISKQAVSIPLPRDAPPACSYLVISSMASSSSCVNAGP
jgi:hypothetical protein